MLVPDRAASLLDFNTSHNDLKRDDADETYCDRNVTSTLQQHNIHFSELPSVGFTSLKSWNFEVFSL